MMQPDMIQDETSARHWLRETLGADVAAMARLERLVELLLVENERQNLVARGTIPHVWQRHIVDSAQLLAVPRETVPAGLWLDLGSGAGFPGLVVAALQPEREVVLVDSRRLRIEWLQRAAGELSLTNVRAVLARVEDLELDRAAVISARAFAPLEKLLQISARFSTPETLWVLPKGASAQQELSSLTKKWQHVFHVEQSLTDSAAGIVIGHLLGYGNNEAPQRQRGKRR